MLSESPLEDRAYHTVVWSEDAQNMIIWGGMELPIGKRYKNGAKYNPGTDTWTMLSDTFPLQYRAGHTAIWTGTDMVVWGGFTGGSCKRDGAKYNLETDTWTETGSSESVFPGMEAHSGRYNHTAVWTGKVMIIWGGNQGFHRFNDGAVYTP
jgi:hypothetical protein